MSRPSTTVKVTLAHVELIHRFIRLTGQGVIVRHKGEELPIDYVAGTKGNKASKFCRFWQTDGDDINERCHQCTIHRTTLQQIERELGQQKMLRELEKLTTEDVRICRTWFKGEAFVRVDGERVEQPFEVTAVARYAYPTVRQFIRNNPHLKANHA